MTIELQKSDYLISRSQQRSSLWARTKLLTGEANVLRNPLIEQANQRILETFEPQHDAVIFSLCSSTRPYYKSPKWGALVKRFGHRADLVICSNGGVIPMQYAHCWPFMQYDARRTTSGKFDDDYVAMLGPRVSAFLERFSYSTAVHLFKDTSRNARVVGEYELPGDVLPSPAVYGQLQQLWQAGDAFFYRMHPHAHPLVLDELDEYLSARGA